jgi:hypothetical protein
LSHQAATTIDDDILNNQYIIIGIIRFRFSYLDIEIRDEFNIKIEFPYDYPKHLPKVFDVTNRIPDGADSHNNKSSTGFCLGTEAEIRQRIFNMTPTFINYIRDLVIPFLYAQSYKEKYEKYPWITRSHCEEGIIEECRDYFCFSDNEQACKFLLELAKYKNTLKGHVLCPCGSKKRFKYCHRDKYQERLKYYSHIEMIHPFRKK